MLTHSSPRLVSFAVRLAAALMVVSLTGCPSGQSSGGSGSGDTNQNANDNGTGDTNQNDNGAGDANQNDNGAGDANQNDNTGASRPGGRPLDPDAGASNAICGDGKLEAGEECDDSNTVAGDGCDANCQTETGTGGGGGDGDGCDPACEAGFECANDACVAVCDPACAADETCVNGVCETAAAGCDPACAANETCVDGVCEPVVAVCGDGTQDVGEECDDSNTDAGDGCDANCRVEDDGGGGNGGGGNGGGGTDPVCGDGSLDDGEECDDGNTASGDGCDANCQTENGGGLANDSCSTPQTVVEGTISFVTDGATTDSISIVETCSSANPIEWAADVWFRYEATCTGTATISLCGSRYDTTAAVYEGTGCPSAAALQCNDDGCGTGSDLPSSRVTFPAVEGNSYMIRIGGYVGESGPFTGTGSLTIFCGNASGRGPANCGSGGSDCFTVDPGPTCSDAGCCSTICNLDPYCCDVEWDGVCVEEGIGICGEGFAACTGASGDCFAENPDQTPGCETSGCCQSVCEEDPFCCLDYWDEFCAQTAVLACSPAEVCAGATGSCFGIHDTPGCGTRSCCESVCLEDPFCCTTEWDQSCVDLAASCR